MIAVIRKRTKNNEDGYIITELNTALDWCWQQLYLINPDIRLTFGTTGSLSADAQALDLATAINTTIYGIKTFWIKGAADTDYIPVVFRDENDPEFLALYQLTPVQVVHPVLCAIYNFNQLRFANQLPSGTNWKADWFGTPPDLSLNTQCVTTYPAPLHNALVDYATALVYDSLDETRADKWFGLAQQRLNTANRNVKRRQFLTKTTTEAYPGRGSRSSVRPRP